MLRPYAAAKSFVTSRVDEPALLATSTSLQGVRKLPSRYVFVRCATDEEGHGATCNDSSRPIIVVQLTSHRSAATGTSSRAASGLFVASVRRIFSSNCRAHRSATLF